MTLITTVSELRCWRTAVSAPVVLVPTMGALHEGHFALVREARRLAGPGGTVLVTVFVNPLQFGPKEDLERYPRTLEADVAGCATAGGDAVFAPSAGEVYAEDRSILIAENRLSKGLCGASRPGHFDGVCTVVTKLFNLAQPDAAVFGKKDYQQLAIIRRLVRDLNMAVEIHGLETVREEDGLAMSSRNLNLSEVERVQATALRKALLAGLMVWQEGGAGVGELKVRMERVLKVEAPLGKIDYLEVVDAETLEVVNGVGPEGGGLIALAVFFEKARLIDNVELR